MPSGQGLVEYSLIGLLVLIVCVGALKILSGGIDGLMQRLHASTEVTQEQKIAIANQQARPSTPSSGQGRQFVTLKGSTISLPPAIDDMGTTIKTLGSNGTTSILATSLEVLVAELVANNELTEQQAQSLIELANKGHSIAVSQKLFEDIIANTKTTKAYRAIIEKDATLTFFDGESFNYLLGYYVPSAGDPLQPGVESHGAAGELLDAYHAAVASGALDDPAVRAVVDALTRNITNLTHTSAHTFASLARDEIVHSEVNGVIAENIEETHNNSTQICSTGNGKDTGKQCSGKQG